MQLQQSNLYQIQRRSLYSHIQTGFIFNLKFVLSLKHLVDTGFQFSMHFSFSLSLSLSYSSQSFFKPNAGAESSNEIRQNVKMFLFYNIKSTSEF
jgi:hypothetical protein